MISYKSSGVDIDKADALTDILKNTVDSNNMGMFAGIYEHPFIPEYYLVGCTDGVGTKVIPLIERKAYGTIAKDLIAMNLNDMICTGALPMFFLDYFATHTLDVEVSSVFVKALKEELAKYNCILLGGETAELKDLVVKGHFDVGGFAVGIVKKDNALKKDNVKANDIVIGLKSSGPHSNGYTLIRKLFSENLITKDEFETSLAPTDIYVNEILELTKQNLVKICANITGGGIEGNLCRVIPDSLCAKLDRNKIPKFPLFDKFKQVVGEEEAFKAFNMGVGLTLVVAPENKDKVFEICAKYEPFEFGRVIEDETSSRVRLG